MGLFNKSNQPARRQIRTMHKERPNENSDLQYKAKSKLIGAVVLAALGAVILPFIFKSDEPIQSTDTPPQAPLVSPSAQQEVGTASGAIAISTAPGVSVQGVDGTSTPEVGDTSVAGQIDTTDLNASTEIPQSIASSVGNNTGTNQNNTQGTTRSESPRSSATTTVPATTLVPTPTQSVASNTASQSSTPVNTSTPATKPAVVDNKPTVKPDTEPKRTVQKEEPKRTTTTASTSSTKTEAKTTTKVDNVKRTDDGSAARALLEGKTTTVTNSATTGKANSSFPKPQSSASTANKQRLSVQVASYSSMDDARAQRDRLSASGVSNVFVQNAVVNGRQTYRLRVGPFNSQESAQAALTRLRGLGHNGFITSN